MVLTSGQRIGAYEVLGLLGAGGMGEVYHARDTRLNRDVAIKVLPETFALDAARLARFQREAQLLASLNHPNIAVIHGFEESAGPSAATIHALVMELVDGPTLADRIGEGPIPIPDAFAIASQIADALGAAHDQGVIHRDLKPANIKLRTDGTVKVLDFGLAKSIEPAASGAGPVTMSPTITTPAMTQAGMILGTATYMSPEQAKGRPADKRSDIWAFGCVLYEMLTGRRAFDGEDVSDTLASVLKSEPDWSAIAADVPSSVRTLLKRCLAKDPRTRVRDIAAAQFVLSDFVDLGNGGNTSAASSRTSRIRLGAQLTVAAIAGAAAVGLALWRPAPPAISAELVRFSFALPAGQEFPANGRHHLAVAPDASQFVFATATGLFSRSGSDLEPLPLPGAQGEGSSVDSPTFSPEGRWIVFYSDGALRRIDAKGGAPFLLCRTRAPFGLSWDQSGILFGAGFDGIYRCPSTGGEPEQLVRVEAGELAGTPQLLPDGEHVLFSVAKVADGVSRWDRAEIVAYSLKSRQRKLIVKNGSDGRYLPTGHLVYAREGVVLAGRFDLSRLAIDGEPVPVIDGVMRSRAGTSGVAQFVTSPGGALFYIPGPASVQQGQVELAVADRGTTTRLMIPPGHYVHVRASRDGRRLAIGAEEGSNAIVSIYDMDGKTALRRLALDNTSRFPIWAPEGDRIAFQSSRVGNEGLFMQRVDGTGPVEQLRKAAPGESLIPESWSRDGNHLLFSVFKNDGYRLSVLSLRDKMVTAIADTLSLEPHGAVFSWDGRWLAYALSTSYESGRTRVDGGVFIRPFPSDGGAVYPVPKLGRAFHPVWSSRGDTLFYVPSVAAGTMAGVPIRMAPYPMFGNSETFPARVTGDRLSVEARAYDILLDGKFVGLIAAGSAQVPAKEAARDQFHVTLNWFEELRRRVPPK